MNVLAALVAVLIFLALAVGVIALTIWSIKWLTRVITREAHKERARLDV